MHKYIALLVFNSLFLQILVAAPQSADDFAYMTTLSEAKTSLRKIELPLTIYEKMQRKDYGDLRIFSAEGQIVPHQFSQLEERPNSKQETPLIFYPFSKKQAANPSNIQVIIKQKKGEQNLSINQQMGNNTAPKENEYQYIIENPKKNPALCKLKLDWTQSKPSSIITLKLESSDKLQNWKTLSHKLTVSKLNYSGSQLIHNEISFTCTSQKYLRLTWLQANQQVHLNQIKGIFSQKGELQTQWQNLGKPHYYEEGNWLFESNLIAAISSIEFIAPNDGLLYKGTLYSRNNEKETWRYRKAISQYRLNIGETTIQSSPLTFAPTSDRYWKMETTSEGRLSDNQLPEIRAGWVPKQLHFLAQGKGPFQLAFGNPTIKPAQNNDLNSLIQSLKQSAATIDKVTFGEIINNNKSFVTESKTPWKIILLWLVLILGTALMAFMAFRLYQQMGDGRE